MLDDAELKNVMLGLLRTQKERDKQRKIGASGIGDPCAYCLANNLLGPQGISKSSPYWLGAKIGDAIHMLLEIEGEKHLQDTTGQFKSFNGARLEKPVYIGDIPGYGSIWSTPDLYLTAEGHLVDYKTSMRKKVDLYKLGDLPTKYVYQVQLYARALEDMGMPVEKISFVFINRDGQTDNDVTVLSLDYDRSLADAAWDRVVSAWEWLQDGNDPETLPSDPECFVCSVMLHRV